MFKLLVENKIMILTVYYIVVNCVTILYFGFDKYFSIKNKWRVKESKLFFLMFIGGFIGAAMGMKIFHHKTRKALFKVVLVLSFLFHICAIYYIFMFN